jgi:3-oxoacyl-[acyl-carrier protein] reductase
VDAIAPGAVVTVRAVVVEFLATDLSDYVTGQMICVCGGMVLSPS